MRLGKADADAQLILYARPGRIVLVRRGNAFYYGGGVYLTHKCDIMFFML